MLERVFQLLGVEGFLIICMLAFIIPKNPYKIIPAISMMSFDKPLWLCIVITGGFFYLIILYSIYDKLYNIKN